MVEHRCSHSEYLDVVRSDGALRDIDPSVGQYWDKGKGVLLSFAIAYTQHSSNSTTYLLVIPYSII